MESIPNVAVRYAVYFAIGYALLVLVVFLLQRNLIYFPDRERPPADRLRSMGLQFWPDGSDFKGLTSTVEALPAKGTVIVFHGNAGSAWHRDYYVHALEPLGYRVVLAEYPGYGGRRGKMNEKNAVSDAREIITKARSQFGDPLFLLGESMGSGVAAAAAADAGQPISGLVMVTPWDSLPSLAQSHYWYLPARWLVKDQFDSISNLQSFDRPVAIAMALNDEVIPNKHTMALFNAVKAPKRLWKFENAGHNSWPTQPNAPWWKEVMAFVSARSSMVE
jgi:alpha-beta hydrolase superfamily lysophospholipase